MAAYVASARIDGGRPRVVGPAGSPADHVDRRAFTATEAWVLDTSPPGQRDLELRWEGVRERWSQLWFFVLDPESWR
ncbi:MAG TPA: hypothetical protein VFO05_03180 [Candidatus Limnocylindrales bacterium]|nr:hypothetical protein [Candidatus Limnocylindrales bacterium]